MSAPTRVAATGRPAAIASAHDRPNDSARRDGTSATRGAGAQPRELAVVHAAGERHVAAEPRRERPQLALLRAGARDRRAAAPPRRTRAIARSTPLSVARRPATSAYVPSAGRARSPGATGSTGFGTTVTARAPSGAPSARSRVSANALGVVSASAEATSRPDQRASAAAYVDGLGARAAAVAAHAGARVAPVAARAVARRRVHARPDRADEPVLVQRQDRARAGLARRLQRAPAVRRVDVVRVDDAGAGAAHGGRDLLGVQPAAQQAARRGSRTTARCCRAAGRRRPRRAARGRMRARSSTTRSSPPGVR